MSSEAGEASNAPRLSPPLIGSLHPHLGFSCREGNTVTLSAVADKFMLSICPDEDCHSLHFTMSVNLNGVEIEMVALVGFNAVPFFKERIDTALAEMVAIKGLPTSTEDGDGLHQASMTGAMGVVDRLRRIDQIVSLAKDGKLSGEELDEVKTLASAELGISRELAS